MAEIFLAKQSGVGGFRRHIVLKRILPAHASDRNWVASFLNEAALAAALNHPNIVQVYDVGRHRDSYIMAMEYIDGADLETLIKAHRDVGSYMPLRVALTYLADVLCALDYAHDARDMEGKPLGLIHRDISTSNVMVSTEGQAKILDFGIAKMLEPANDVEKTQVGVVRGKASCLAPEQVRGQPIDRRVDVHACGVVLFELLTNQNPFKGPDQISTLRAVLELNPSLPADRLAEVPEPIRYVLQKALAKDPDDRFSSCGAMLSALEHGMERCGYGFSRTQARNYMRVAGHDTASEQLQGLPKTQDELTEDEIEQPEEKTRNVRRPTALSQPIAQLEGPSQPVRLITPSSLSLFELDDVIADDGRKPLNERNFVAPEPQTNVRDVRWRRRAAHAWPAAVACAAFFVLTSFHAWQPAAAEAPELAFDAEQTQMQALDEPALMLAAPSESAQSDAAPIDDKKDQKAQKKQKRGKKR
jgi:serine/threonine-protein kinase